MHGFAIPLADAADDALTRLARATGSAAIAVLDGGTLLGERARLMGMTVAGRTSAGGACRLIDAKDDAIALNLARPADRELLPALFEDDTLDPENDNAIALRIARAEATTLVERGRLLGLPIAAVHEHIDPAPEASVQLAPGLPASPRPNRRPRVIDLSALWAGPLAGHLLYLAGCEVIKVESPARPDSMRQGQADFYALLNQGKASVALDLRDEEDRRRLLALIADADIIIEAARPRALEQLGIDAGAIVRSTPGLIWLTITGHGAADDEAGWVGFGDDVGVAAGLSAAMLAASGRLGFVGDAIADPLTGIHAALFAWRARQIGLVGRFGIAMRDIVAICLQERTARDPRALQHCLAQWADSEGQSFPPVQPRSVSYLPAFGSGLALWSDPDRC